MGGIYCVRPMRVSQQVDLVARRAARATSQAFCSVFFFFFFFSKVGEK